MARPPHKASEDARKTVRLLSGFGIPHDQIAAEIGVSPPTLHKHYQEDLDAGTRQANARVAQSLFKKATGEGSQSVTAAIWWTKARMGWRGESVEVTGKDGAPFPVTVYIPANGREDGS